MVRGDRSYSSQLYKRIVNTPPATSTSIHHLCRVQLLVGLSLFVQYTRYN